MKMLSIAATDLVTAVTLEADTNNVVWAEPAGMIPEIEVDARSENTVTADTVGSK